MKESRDMYKVQGNRDGDGRVCTSKSFPWTRMQQITKLHRCQLFLKLLLLLLKKPTDSPHSFSEQVKPIQRWPRSTIALHNSTRNCNTYTGWFSSRICIRRREEHVSRVRLQQLQLNYHFSDKAKLCALVNQHNCNNLHTNQLNYIYITISMSLYVMRCVV